MNETTVQAIGLRALGWLLLAAGAASVGAHDMFLILEDHDVPAESKLEIALYNGTFDESLNTIDRDRMVDVSVVDGSGGQTHPTPSQWREEGMKTVLELETGAPGTYIVGVSTAPRMIELTAEEFNEYLRHDGVLDVLQDREDEGALDRPARERYSKHVKSILQVGDGITDSHTYLLGYPIEIVPQSNPAQLNVGDTMRVLVMAEGAPASNQLVYASHEGHHGHEDSGEHQEALATRTDQTGVAEIEITHAGRWYIRLIRMLPVDEPEVDYESNWATLTFEVE